MLNRLFGNYLVEKGKITLEALNALLAAKEEIKAGVEVIAIITKAMTPAAVKELSMNINKDSELFGEAAVDASIITDDKLDELLAYQSNAFMKFIQLLVDNGCLSYEDINHELDAFQQKSGFSDVQLNALIHDDVEQCVNIFVPLKSQNLKELTMTLVQTFRRIIDKDFYLEKAYTAHSIQLDKYACQTIAGDMHVRVYISAPGDGLLAIANYFTGDTYETVTDDALDSVGEFINCVNGVFATNMSYENTALDMNSPEYSAEGPFISNELLYVIPMHANGYNLRAVFEVYE
ncbi:MAG: chemotaxis protein CheX [Lachnospiraceae bacterium]|nr:chemotaxis protein CheX [Lachnospiraceae bacterium]